MHFGIPKYRLPREVLDAEIARIAAIGVADRPESQGHRPGGREGGGRLRCGVPRRWRAPEQTAGDPRARRRQDLRRAAVPEGRRARRRTTATRSARRDLRRRQHGDGRRPHRRGGSAPSRSSSTAARASEMPAHDFEADEAIEEGVKIHWLRTIKEIDGTTLHGRGHAARREPLPAADRRVRDARGRLADSRARAGHRHRVSEERPRHRLQEATARWSSGPTCRPAARACSPAATWCRTPAR